MLGRLARVETAADGDVIRGRIARVGLFSAAQARPTGSAQHTLSRFCCHTLLARFREVGTTRALQSMGPGRSLQPSQGQAAVSGLGRPQQRGLAAAVPLSLPRRLTWILTPRCSVSKARQRGRRGRGTPCCALGSAKGAQSARPVSKYNHVAGACMRCLRRASVSARAVALIHAMGLGACQQRARQQQ